MHLLRLQTQIRKAFFVLYEVLDSKRKIPLEF